MTGIAVLVSGSGTNLQALIDSCMSGYIPGEIRLVISSSPDAFALTRAGLAGIETLVFEKKDFEGPDEYSAAVLREVREREVTLICLAGFLLKLGGELLREYEWRIINIHPALLPCFGGKGMYGLRVHRAVLESGDKVSGCTVHYVNSEYDCGPVIEQRTVPIMEGDTPALLAERVIKEEHALYPEVVRKFALGELPRRNL